MTNLSVYFYKFNITIKYPATNYLIYFLLDYSIVHKIKLWVYFL